MPLRRLVVNILFLTGVVIIFQSLTGCATKGDVYHDSNMDFSSLRAVAVLPFENLSREAGSSGRVRDVFMTKLLSTGAVYVIPPGEVARGTSLAGIQNPTAPSVAEILKLAGILKVDAVMTGALREYGEIRSGNTAANSISLSMLMIETQTGKVVWSASTTKGGVTALDRMFGGGGRPMNEITEIAVDDIINKLFK